MNENTELLEHIYQTAEMGAYSITKLMEEINEKDNKIKNLAEEQLQAYEKFLKEAKSIIKEDRAEVLKNGIMAKMASTMGIKKEVKKDNSDAAIAHMLTQGITMGVIDMETKVKNYKDSADEKVLKLGKDFLKFQQDQIEKLKEYM